MIVVITGTSTGIGREAARKFLKEGHTVYGLDKCESTIVDERYTHCICDVSNPDSLPDIHNVNILINNAGVQNSGRDIDVNLKGVINCTNKYAFQPKIISVLNQASVSAHNGAEFPEYSASKGGVLAYTVSIAKKLAELFRATCNSISFGGVVTPLNKPVIQDSESWHKIMDMTPLKKWVEVKEAAEWIYFLTAVNRSMTAQDVIIDNGEMNNHTFVWK